MSASNEELYLEISLLKQQVEKMEKDMVTKDQFQPVKIICYAIIGSIGLAVMNGIVKIALGGL